MLTSRCAGIYKKIFTRKCPSLSEKAGRDVICPFQEDRMIRCPTTCDATSRHNCFNCAFLVKCSDGAPYCLAQYGQGCITDAGSSCIDWWRRDPEEEDPGEYIERRVVEMGGVFTDGLEPPETRRLRVLARQEWKDAHFSGKGGSCRRLFANQGVSSQDAVRIGELMDKAADEVDWRDGHSIEHYKRHGKAIPELLETEREG